MKALVTGAASGIGKALVERFLELDMQVAGVDRDAVGNKGNLVSIRADLASRQDVDRLIVELKNHGPFDYVVHNAGISATGKFEHIPDEAYRRLLTVNTETPLVMTSALLAAGCIVMDTRIIFISSLSHSTGYPGAAVYGASKDALAVYAKSLRKSLFKDRIHVMTVFPGPVRTDHAERHAPPGAKAERRMEPGEIADRIITAARQRKKVLYPGKAANFVRIIGAVMPETTTRFMRLAIFEKLQRSVY